MTAHNMFCFSCGEEFTEEDFRKLEFVSGGPFGYVSNGEEVRTGFVEHRRCSRCPGEVVRRVDYDPDGDPPTERNPVPTVRPTPGLQ